jgi:hypothetical protein
MRIGSLLALISAATVGLAALHPHAAEAGDFPPLSFRISPAKPKNDIVVAQASGDPAPASAESTGTTSPTAQKFVPDEGISCDWCCTVQRHLHTALGDQFHRCRYTQAGWPYLLEQGSQRRSNCDIQRHLHQRMGNEQRGPPHRSPAVGLTAASLHGVSAMGRRLQLVRPRPD